MHTDPPAPGLSGRGTRDRTSRDPAARELPGRSGRTGLSTAEHRWRRLLPDLPDEVIELLAMPVLVPAGSVLRTAGATRPLAPDPPRQPEPDPEPGYPAPMDPCSGTDGAAPIPMPVPAPTKRSPSVQCTPRFLAPAAAPPYRTAWRRGSTPTSR